MTKTAVVTARVSEETLALLDRVAAAKDRSRAWVIARAIEKQAKAEAEFLDFVQEGIDAADRGDLVDHEEVFREFRVRRALKPAA